MSGAAGGVRQPRKLSDVTEVPQRVGSVAVVNAFGLVGHGHPVRSWVVSVLCPFGCSESPHRVVSGLNLPRFEGDHVEICPIAIAVYSVIVPKSLLLAAFHVTVCAR